MSAQLNNFYGMGHARGIPRVSGFKDFDALTRADGTIDHAASAEANTKSADQTAAIPRRAWQGIKDGSSVFDGGTSTLPRSVNAAFGLLMLVVSPVMFAEVAIDRAQARAHTKAAARGAVTVTSRTPPSVAATLMGCEG